MVVKSERAFDCKVGERKKSGNQRFPERKSTSVKKKKENLRLKAEGAVSPFFQIRVGEVAVQPQFDRRSRDWKTRPSKFCIGPKGFFSWIDCHSKGFRPMELLGRLRIRNPRTYADHRIRVLLTLRPSSFPRKIHRTCLPKPLPEEAQEADR